MWSVSRIRKVIKIPRAGIGGGKEKVAHAGEAGLGGTGLGPPNSIMGRVIKYIYWQQVPANKRIIAKPFA
jgi:hypothetical protein